MVSEKLLNILSAISLLVMMAYICNGLARQFDPDQIYSTAPAYTIEAFKEKEREATRYKTLYRDNDRILGDIARARMR